MGDAVIVGRAAKQNKQAMRWQRECVEISRQKAKSRSRHNLKRKILLGVSVLAVTYLGAAGYWVWSSGQIGRAYDGTKDWLYGITRGAGFEMTTIQVDGLSKLSVEMVSTALGVQIGDPIFRVAVQDVKEKLEALPEIRVASVERRLPDMLYVEIVERDGAALWQHDGQYQLIDVDGTVLVNQERDPGRRYIVLTGENVPEEAEAFLAMLDMEPELKRQVEAAMRVGARRWDIRLKNGVVVKLPQEDPDLAWRKLGEMARNQQLLDRSLQVIDMRIDDRMFLTLDPPAKGTDGQVVTSARDI